MQKVDRRNAVHISDGRTIRHRVFVIALERMPGHQDACVRFCERPGERLDRMLEPSLVRIGLAEGRRIENGRPLRGSGVDGKSLASCPLGTGVALGPEPGKTRGEKVVDAWEPQRHDLLGRHVKCLRKEANGTGHASHD